MAATTVIGGFLTGFETAINTNFFAMVGTVSSNVTSMFQAAFTAGLGIWIMLTAYDVAWGKTEDGLTYIISSIGKKVLIGVFALWGWVYVQDAMYALADAFLIALSGSSSIANVLETNILVPLWDSWNSLWDAFLLVLGSFSAFSIGQWISEVFNGLVLILAYVCLTASAFSLCIVTLSMYCVALASFYICLAIGPVFLMCLAFPFLQRYFESWVGVTVTAILGMAITAMLAVMAGAVLGLGSLAAVLPSATPANLGLGTILGSIVGKIGTGFLLIFLYFKVFDLATALGGGMNIGGVGMGAMRALAHSRSQQKLQQNMTPPSPPNAVAGPSLAARSASAAARAGSSGARAVGRGAAIAGLATGHAAVGAIRLGQYAYNRGVTAYRNRNFSS